LSVSVLSGKKFQMIVQGCRTNLYEGDALAAALEARGAVRCEEQPDIAVIVTCTITAVADRKCRKLIRRLRRENPEAVIAACGCYVQKITDEECAELGIDIAAGSREKHLLPQLLEEWYGRGEQGKTLSAFDEDILRDDSWDSLTLDRPRLHTRAFLKVQDGCAHFCSYCIVPFVRGKPVSRDMEETVAEARRIAASGCPEIILTGVHLGLYENLAELVRRIGDVEGIKRLRFGSIEPFAVNDELLSALAETPAFCRHLHMPLQSGDDGVLKRMRRGYTSDEFMAISDNVREKLGGDTHISTDLMIGFPGEDAAAFDNSIKFIEKVKFGKMHIFPYSPREGTDAAKWQCPPQDEVRAREHEALELAAELHKNYCSRWIGREVEILAEEVKDETVIGLTPEYVRVAAKANSAAVSDFLRVMPKRWTDGLLTDGEAGAASGECEDIF
jgi:threonylcarbamoyladenosine tRNA methylthiotransferase MtaB